MSLRGAGNLFSNLIVSLYHSLRAIGNDRVTLLYSTVNRPFENQTLVWVQSSSSYSNLVAFR
jgi:hypothetical protein